MNGCLYTSERTSVIHQDILDYVDELSEEVNKIKTDMQKLKLEFLIYKQHLVREDKIKTIMRTDLKK